MVIETCTDNGKTKVKQTVLEIPVLGRWFRFIPITGNCMRIQLYGCRLQSQQISKWNYLSIYITVCTDNCVRQNTVSDGFPLVTGFNRLD